MHTQQNEAFWESFLKDFLVEEDDDAQPKKSLKPTGYNTQTVSLSVPYTLLKQTAQTLDSSVTAILRAAWSSMVIDFYDISDKKIVIGEVLSERRMDSSLDNVIGPLVSMIPAPFSAVGSTREILSRTDQNGTWKHRRINPGTIRKIIRRPQNQALYPAVFVFHPKNSVSEAEVSRTDGKLWKEIEDLIGLNVMEDLTLNVEEQANGRLDLVVSAEKSVLDLEGLALLAKQLDALIAAMVSFPDLPLIELTNHFPEALLSRTKPRDFKVPDVVSYDNPLCWFDHWVKVSPDASAVEIAGYIAPNSSKTVSLSYSKLNEEANQVRNFISSLGIHGRMIGMCLGRTLDSFAITLGIFKSGNTYLPIDEDLPEERVSFLLQDSSAAIFFTTRQAEAPAGCKVVNIEKDEYQLTGDFPSPSLSKDAPAYLLYTSGSTGNPKGVLISSGNLTAFCEAQSEFICTHCPATRELAGKGKYLGLASRAFDVHVGEMFLAWRWGLALVTAKRSLLLDDLRLALRELKVTHASFVPSLLDQVGLSPSDVPLLRYLGVGGEKISQRTLEVWGGSDQVALINAYGPTEVTIGCASACVTGQSNNMRNIGKPLGDLVAHVLIPGTLTYAKRGMEGELCFTGSLVGIGYHNRDTGAFVEDFHGSRMYRTGDLVRLMSDDSIEIYGRADDQTKIRGQRLELGEVSNCVRMLCPEPADVATIITKHPDLSRLQLVSFVASSQGSSKNEKAALLNTFSEVNSTIRNGCKQKLPAYMVPDVVIPLTYLPLAATSGKADIKQLKALFASIPLRQLLTDNGLPSSVQQADRELNEDEAAVVKILASVVRKDLPDMKPSTNIFEIGVDSLVAISLSTKLRKSGYDCSVADILGLRTVEELALLPRIGDSDKAEANQALVREKFAQIEAQFRNSVVGEQFGSKAAIVRPCLPLQEAVVARSFSQESKSLYVNHIILELSENIDIERLRAAWKASAKDNEIFRTCFCQVEDNFLQVVLTDDAFELSWAEEKIPQGTDVLDATKIIRNAIAMDIIEKIQEMPPMRFHLVRPVNADSPTKALLCISIHHALYDAESLGLIMEDVYLRYESRELPVRPSAAALVEYIAAQDEQHAKEFWTKRLQDYRPETPIEHNDPSSDEAHYTERVFKNSLSSLESSASRLQVTVPTLAQGIFGLAFAKANSINDFVFGLVLSGRTSPIDGINQLLAPSITTVPQRIDMRNGDATVLDILSSIQKSSGQVLRFQHTSLRAVHRWVQADRPLFNCLFSYINAGGPPVYDHLWKEIDNYMPPDYPFAIEFEANQISDTLTFRTGYTSEFGSQSKVENLLEMMELLMESIGEGNSLTLGDLGIEGTTNSEPSRMDLPQTPEEFSEEELKIKDTLLDFVDLGLDDISKHSTFFRLGIDSIVAINFAKKLRSAGFQVSTSDIIRYPSIALLAENLSSKTKEKELPTEVSQPSSDIEKYRAGIPLLATGDHISEMYVCTPLQTGLLTQTVANGGQLYVHHPSVVLSAGIDIKRLEAAWYSVVERHDILRTTFHYLENSEVPWIAAVHEKSHVSWSEIDTSESFEQCIGDITKNTAFPTIESFAVPPVHARVIRSPLGIALTISIHHSLYDGWSLPLIFDALLTAYLHGLQSPKTQFFEAARLITQNQSNSVNFWLNKIDGYESIEIPASTPQGPNTTSFSSIAINMPTTEVLNKCKLMDLNFQSVALLAYAKALCHLVKRRDICFGQVVSGRSLQLDDVDRVIGPLFNTLPYRVRFESPLLSNKEMATQIQETVVQGHSHQHASLNQIQKLWRQKTSSESSLIDALFVFQKPSVDSSESLVEKLWDPLPMDDDRDATEYSLNVELEQGENVITLSVASPANCLSPDDLDIFCSRYDEILRDILDSPTRSATAYPGTFLDLPLSIKVEKKQTDFKDVAESPALAIIRNALSEVSGISEEISPETTIYALGIDSIAAIRIGSICRRNGVFVSVADVLQGVSLGGITRLVISKASVNAHSTNSSKDIISSDEKSKVMARIKNFPNTSIEQILPCLPGQVYHLLGWLKSGLTTYEPTWAFSSRAKLDIERLKSAWFALQHRNPILRTIFVALGPEKAYQIILKPEVVGIDGSTFTVAETSEPLEVAVKEAVRVSSSQPSTLFTPGISLKVIQGQTQDAVLIKIHHSLYDAWSMGYLVTELPALYYNQALIPNPSFPEFVQYIETATDSTKEREYWKSSLASAQRTILIPETPEDQVVSQPSLKQTFVWFRKGIVGLEKMNRITRDCGLALSTVFIMAFGRALGRKTKTSNPTFGFFQAARSAEFADAIRVPGPCVNLLPLSTPVARENSDLKTALDIQEGLGKRVAFEQSHLINVLRCIEDRVDSEAMDIEPLFNASLNLLWHVKQVAGVNTDMNDETPQESLLDHMDIGVPTDFAAESPIEGETAVDELDTGYLASQNLYMDVGPMEETDSIDFAVKCDYSIMDEARARGFIEMVVEEAVGILENLERQGKD